MDLTCWHELASWRGDTRVYVKEGTVIDGAKMGGILFARPSTTY